jgi:hypothetical protein
MITEQSIDDLLERLDFLGGERDMIKKKWYSI